MTFEHLGLLFQNERQFHEAARTHVRAAVHGHGRAVLAVSEHRAAGVLEALRPTERRHVHVTDRDALYEAPGRALAALHRMALVHDPTPVTVVAEPRVASGSAMETREWHRLESVLSTALAPMRLRLLCVHDDRDLCPHMRSAIRATHPLMVGADGPRPNPDYMGTAAFGTRPSAPEPLPATGPAHRLEIGQSLPRLRRELAALGNSMGLPEERLDSLVVAVNELAANVLEHGAGKGTIHVWRAPGRWVCDVLDEQGGLVDPLTGYRPVDTMRPRGYGLWISRQACEYLEISGSSAGSMVRLHFLDRTGDDQGAGPAELRLAQSPTGPPPARDEPRSIPE